MGPLQGLCLVWHRIDVHFSPRAVLLSGAFLADTDPV